MTKSRSDGLYLLLLGAVLFLAMGFFLDRSSTVAMIDFKGVYCSARCLLEHADPYDRDQLLRVYLAEGGASASDPPIVSQVVVKNFYLPSAFVLTVPFAALAYPESHLLWTGITAASFILAAFLIWQVSAKRAPVVSGGLIALLLANSASLLTVGNPAGIALSLCAIAVWCFVEERFVLAGIAFLALSLAIKPNDGGLVWLYFLLAGGAYRKRSITTSILVAAMCLPVVLWVSSVAPHWTQEQRSNMLLSSTNGDLNDPGPASINTAHSIDSLIQLQTVTSIFWNAPRAYNAAAFLVCAPLLFLWILLTLRARPSPANTWLAIAAIVPLSLLPLYHRTHDARLLLLTLPACATLLAEGGALGWFAIALNAAATLLVGEIPSMMRVHYVSELLASTTLFSGSLPTAILTRPVPLVALATAVFYLWVYFQRVFERNNAEGHCDTLKAPAAKVLDTL